MWSMRGIRIGDVGMLLSAEMFSARFFRSMRSYSMLWRLGDLLGTKRDLAGKIPEDRGTNDFDSNRKIQLSRETLGSYFSVADELLDGMDT